METYTVMISLGGILALISAVALLTFYNDLKKYFRFRMLKVRRSRKQKYQGLNRIHNLNALFEKKGHSYYLKQKKNVKHTHHQLKEENGVI
jgi:hypothetical protein